MERKSICDKVDRQEKLVRGFRALVQSDVSQTTGVQVFSSNTTHYMSKTFNKQCLFFCPALFMSFNFNMRGGGEFVLRHGGKVVPHKLGFLT